MISYQPLTIEDMPAIMSLQAQFWGADNTIPPSIFSVANTIGGVAIGAFSQSQLVGFILSIPAVWESENTQWSCRLLVCKDHQNKGIGKELKTQQKNALIKMGINSLLWSYNPYDLKNAHLNLNKLQARIIGINPKMYPVSPSERVIVRWDLTPQNIKITPSVMVLIPTDASGYKGFVNAISSYLQDGYVGVSIHNNQYAFGKYQ